METIYKQLGAQVLCATVTIAITSFVNPAAAVADSSAHALDAIPGSKINPNTRTACNRAGLSITSTSAGTYLRCSFHRLEGEATSQGLWITSTVTYSINDRFRIVATALSRELNGVGDP